METIKHALGYDNKSDTDPDPSDSKSPPEDEQGRSSDEASKNRNEDTSNNPRDKPATEQSGKGTDDRSEAATKHTMATDQPSHRDAQGAPLRQTTSNSHLGAGEIPCPDPSVHQRNTQLQEQASKAALYVTHPEQATNVRSNYPLDADNKLSSAGAATSLKYARPQDLPSFPVVGINTQSSAGAAASLANANKKSFEYWKPDPSASAGKAALLANDYKMAPLWKPEASAAGSKAALLAHKDGGKLNLWMPEETPEGHSAAVLAMREKGLSPKLDYGYTEDGHKKALKAATGALSNSQRRRSGSTPTPVASYPDAQNSEFNALNAAKVSDANRLGSRAMEAARIQNIKGKVPREMFTEHPPVAIEVEEQRHQAALHASAVSMAKQMYQVQQKLIGDAASADGHMGARTAHERRPSPADQDIKQQAMQYIHLQETAQKLAAERLAKLEPDEATKFRTHYGYGPEPPRSRLSLRGRNRRRASSENALPDSDDEEQSRRIRSQMNQFSESLAQVDAKKRQKDRDALLQAAEKRVQARMHDIDEKVFMETGKVPPAMMEEWEAKARARAAADSEARMANHGKVHIGGGKFLDQSEIDAIAAARLKPTLDEITETADKQRARDEELRLEQEERKRQAQNEKEREAELKAEQKRAKNEEKQIQKTRKLEEKAAARTEKVAEKAKRAEEKRIAKEEKRKSTEVKRTSTEAKPAPAVETTTTEPQAEPATEVEALPEAETRPSVGSELARVTTTESESVHGTEADIVAHRVLTAPVTDKVPTIPPLKTTEDTATTLPEPAPDVHIYEPPAEEAPAPQKKTVTVEPPPTSEPVKEPVKGPVKEPTTEPAREPAKERTVRDITFGRSDSKGGLKGLFGKFKRRSKAPHEEKEKKPATSAAASAAVASTPTTAKVLAAGGTNPTTAATDTASPTAHTTTAAAASVPLSSPSEEREVSPRGGGAVERSPSISSLSSSDAEEERRGRTGRRVSGVSDGDGDGSEEFEEARDTFDEGLAPPPSFGSKGKGAGESPVRDSRFQEAL